MFFIAKSSWLKTEGCPLKEANVHSEIPTYCTCNRKMSLEWEVEHMKNGLAHFHVYRRD